MTPVRIDLWLWDLDIDAAAAARSRKRLTAPEQARADRFVHARDKVRFIAGRARLREILATYTGADPAGLPLREGPHGKPIVPGGPGFNLSHAAGRAALAICQDPALPLGVDIEGARTIEPGVADRAFAPEERAALAKTPPDAWHGAFFRGWTRKEALVKATGEGLTADLTSFAVSLNAPARVERIDGDRPADWRLYDFQPAPGLAGAIAAMTGGRPLAIHHHG